MVTRSEYVDFSHYSYDYVPFENFSKNKENFEKALKDAKLWSISQVYSAENGYNATVYVNNNTKEVVIAYAGTNPSNLHDLYNDYCILANQLPPQFVNALQTYQEQAEKYQGYKITVTGHSLGGVWAQLISVVTGADAITFNTVGVAHLLPELPFNVSLDPSSYTNITNYNIEDEWLHNENLRRGYQQLGNSFVLPPVNKNELGAHNDFEGLKVEDSVPLEIWIEEHPNECGRAQKENNIGLEVGTLYELPAGNLIAQEIMTGKRAEILGMMISAEVARIVQYQDPLLIDLDGDGIETTTIENGVYFDHGNDGFEELSAWVGVDDGILVYDKNNNGVIDNGNELFSNNYTKLDGTQAVSGFDALGDFDSNSDGVINSSDTNFDTIKVLKGDGTMMSLSDAGVSSITLLHTNKNVEDANGNVQKTEGTYTRTDGSTSKLGDYLFANDSITTIAKDWLEVPETITELPDIAGMGNVYSLHQAMVRDEELKTLVEGFATTSTPRARQLLVEQIIYKWSGVEAVSTDSRGSSVDGRKLEALEEFVGREFVGMSSSGTQTATNPGVNAGKILTNTFTKLVDYVYAELEAQTVLKPVFEQLEFSYDETLDKYVYDLSTVKSTIDETILTNAVTGKELLLDFAKVFVNLGLEDVSNYADFKSYFVAKGEEYELLFKTIDSINLYGTGDGEDIDGSPEAETIFGYGKVYLAA